MSRSRFVSFLLLLSLVAAVWLVRATRDPWPAEQGIAVPRAEETATPRVLAATITLLDRAHGPGQPVRRSAYAKGHGCLKATVSVPDLPDRLRHGVFARPAEYPAWVRFSNGSERVQSDQHRDARGLALKLMGVPGQKLLASERDAQTQDFVLSGSSRAAIADVASYAALMDGVSRGSRYAWFFDDWSWRPWRWRVRELWLAARASGAPPASLLQTQYYSQTPYRLGPGQIVKYSARPCQWLRPPRRDRTEGMLREGLREELTLGDACFELLVQLQVPGRNMPVEDATVGWEEEDSPFLPVARVTIPKQAFDAPEQDRLCEDLSFTPWHALPAHEPVGGLNRLRRAVYQEISRYRHARNESARVEPQDFCLDLTRRTCEPASSSAVPGAQPVPAIPGAAAEPAGTAVAPPAAVAPPPTTSGGPAAAIREGPAAPPRTARPGTAAPEPLPELPPAAEGNTPAAEGEANAVPAPPTSEAPPPGESAAPPPEERPL